MAVKPRPYSDAVPEGRNGDARNVPGSVYIWGGNGKVRNVDYSILGIMFRLVGVTGTVRCAVVFECFFYL